MMCKALGRRRCRPGVALHCVNRWEGGNFFIICFLSYFLFVEVKFEEESIAGGLEAQTILLYG